MLSDSTGYGGSSSTSSLYSSCIVVPASSTVSSIKYPFSPDLEKIFNQDEINKNQKGHSLIEYDADNYYTNKRHSKSSDKYNQDYVDKFSVSVIYSIKPNN